MELEEALRWFMGDDEAAAREGFDQLCRTTRRFVLHYTRRLVGYTQEDLCEDIVQITFHKIWMARGDLRNQGVAAWYALLKLTAYRTFVDLYRQTGDPPVGIDGVKEPQEPGIEESDEIISALTTALEAGQLYHLANALWLELDRNLSPETCERQLLAAQFYYLDGLSYDEALALLNAGSPGETPLTRETLDSWLEHPGVLRYMAFHELYFNNYHLAAHLLGLGRFCDTQELDKLARAASRPQPTQAPPEGWTWDETRIVLWRFRYALYVEQILAREDCVYSREQLRALLDTIAPRFPFNNQMANLLRSLERFPRAKEDAKLEKPNLWQRLAFQYRYHDELPLLDIQARIQPASQQVSFAITSEKLNWWLSAGHLVDRLRRYVGT